MRWRLSDAHGLCIVEEGAGGRIVADLTPQRDWLPEATAESSQYRAWAEEIVNAHNTRECIAARGS